MTVKWARQSKVYEQAYCIRYEKFWVARGKPSEQSPVCLHTCGLRVKILSLKKIIWHLNILICYWSQWFNCLTCNTPLNFFKSFITSHYTFQPTLVISNKLFKIVVWLFCSFYMVPSMCLCIPWWWLVQRVEFCVFFYLLLVWCDVKKLTNKFLKDVLHIRWLNNWCATGCCNMVLYSFAFNILQGISTPSYSIPLKDPY